MLAHKNMPIKSENGFALIAALMVLVMMFVLAMALVYKVNTSVKSSSNWQNSQQSFIAAEAGIQAAYRYIKTQLDANAVILNTQDVYGEDGFNDEGFPLNGCLDYHPKQTTAVDSKLKSLTNDGSLQTSAPFEDAKFYYWFPVTINGNNLDDNNCDSPENFQSLWCEMDLENASITDDLNDSFKKYGYSYFITSLGNFESISGKKGEELSSSSNQSQKKDYFFKIISCGIGPNARNTIETISNFEK
jgi:type II secretory pathway pseudopilin PulG